MKSIVAVLVLVLAVPSVHGQDRTFDLLKENRSVIIAAARSCSISPRLLAGVIFAEQTLNMAPGEKYLDPIFAYSGYNSSVGIAQIKVDTAEWIEAQISSKNKDFEIPPAAIDSLKRRPGREELVKRLDTPASNCYYAALYLLMIVQRWGRILHKPLNKENAPGIIATLYSIGLTTSDGEYRPLHNDPKMNSFGKKALEFFRSHRLQFEFPE